MLITPAYIVSNSTNSWFVTWVQQNTSDAQKLIKSVETGVFAFLRINCSCDLECETNFLWALLQVIESERSSKNSWCAECDDVGVVEKKIWDMSWKYWTRDWYKSFNWTFITQSAYDVLMRYSRKIKAWFFTVI
jgi:hypothetical protein